MARVLPVRPTMKTEREMTAVMRVLLPWKGTLCVERLEEMLKKRGEETKGEDEETEELGSDERGIPWVWSRGSIGVFKEEEVTQCRWRLASSC